MLEGVRGPADAAKISGCEADHAPSGVHQVQYAFNDEIVF